MTSTLAPRLFSADPFGFSHRHLFPAAGNRTVVVSCVKRFPGELRLARRRARISARR